MNTVDPKHAFRSALRMIRTRPSLLLWKFVADIGSQFARVGTLVVMALVVGTVAIVNLRAGRGMSAAAALMADPRFLVGAGGMILATLLAGFALQSFVWAGIWGSSGARLRGESVGFLDSAVQGFWRSAGVRAVALLHDVAMAANLASLVVCTVAWNRWLELGALGQAISWGAALTLYVCLGVVLRLTASVTAAPMFIDGETWSQAWLSAAHAVARQPLAFYRIFVHAAATLIPAMLVYYVVLFVFNLSYGTPLAPLGEILRLVGEIVMALGFAVFFLVGQLGFFNGYMLAQGGRAFHPPDEAPAMAKNSPPTLSDLLPRELPNRVDVDTLLALRPPPAMHDVGAQAPDADDSDREPAAVASTAEAAQAFDLDSVLRGEEDKDDSGSR